MGRVRAFLGLLAALLLLLSAGAHSLLGWPALRSELAAAKVGADLAGGLEVGWQFGGVSMLAFALVLLPIFLKRWRGEPVSTWPGLVIGVAYVAFGAWALVVRDFDPFFFVFMAPGLFLVLASTGRQPAATSVRR